MAKGLVIIAVFVTMFFGCKMGTSNNSAEQNLNAAATPSRTDNTFQDGNIETNVNAAMKPTAKPRMTNAVCPGPAKPCNHKEKEFDDWELSFKMPAMLAPNKMYSSAPFFALILKTYEIADDCDGGEYIEAVEAERKQLQADQLSRKVFASYDCPNMAAVDYDFEGKYDAKRERTLVGNFMAIYAGETKQEAEGLLAKLKQKYPKAYLTQMTVNYEVVDQ